MSYSRNAAGEVTAIYESGVNPLVGYTYDDLGRRTGAYRGNNAQTFYTYDAAGRLSALNLDLAGTAQDQTYSLTYNAAGQIITRSMSNTGANYVWTPGVVGTKAYTVNGLNQLTTAAGATIAYGDNRGNLTNDGARSFVYDLENRMTSAPGAPGVTLGYDPVGRLDTIVGAITTRLVYSGSDLIEETDAANTTQRRYIPGPGTDEPITWYEGATTSDRRFLLSDERGSVVALTNAYAVATTINAYDEYGVPAAGNLGRFQYTGQAWIPELGLYHYKARAYSPTLGRFLQTDPTGYDDGLNWYSYVDNDPLNRSDPTGTMGADGSTDPNCYVDCNPCVKEKTCGPGSPQGRGGEQSAWGGGYWQGVGERNSAQGVQDEVEGRTQTADGLTLLSMATVEVSWPLQIAGGVSTATAPVVTNNRIAGNAARDALAVGLRAEGRAAATEVYKWTPFGKRFIDIEVSLGGKVLGGIEVKLGGSRYIPAQRAKDAYLWLTQGYRVNVVRIPK